MNIGTIAERPIGRVYHGPTTKDKHNRPISQIEDRFKDLLGSTFDDVLHDQLTKAEAMGKKRFIFLDIGSGDGGLMSDFLSNPEVAPQTRAFLNSHADMKVQFIGLTDSPRPEDHNTQKPLDIHTDQLDEQNRKINQQVEAANYYYTLTRRQTINTFLSSHGIASVDMIMASESLRYFSYKNFQQTVQTAVERLRPGGVFIALGYAGTVPGYRGASNLELNIPHRTEEETKEAPNEKPSLRSILRENYIGMARGELKRRAQRHVSPEDEEKALKKAEEFFIRVGTLSREQIEQERLAIRNDERLKDLSPREQLHVLTNKIVSEAFIKHAERKQTLIDTQKRQFIENFNGVKIQFLQAAGSLTPRGFVLTKE